MNAIASSSRLSSPTLIASSTLLFSSSPHRSFSSSSRWSAATASDNHYKTLGIDRGASKKQIKEKFYELSRQYHPDLTPGDAVAKAKYLGISEAYDTLGNDAKRSLYDRTLSPVPRATHTSTHYTRTGRPSTWTHPSTRLPPRPRPNQPNFLNHHNHAFTARTTTNPTARTGASQPFPLGTHPSNPSVNPDAPPSRFNPLTGRPNPPEAAMHNSQTTFSAGQPGSSAFAKFAANGFGFGAAASRARPVPTRRSPSGGGSSSPSSDPSPSPSPSSPEPQSPPDIAKPLVRRGGTRLDRERTRLEDAIVGYSPQPRPVNAKADFFGTQFGSWMFAGIAGAVGLVSVWGMSEDSQRVGGMRVPE